jgi:hypothetical protein
MHLSKRIITCTIHPDKLNRALQILCIVLSIDLLDEGENYIQPRRDLLVRVSTLHERKV